MGWWKCRWLRENLEGAYGKVRECWKCDNIDASKVEGAVRRIEAEGVWCAINHTKIEKAGEPFGLL